MTNSIQPHIQSTTSALTRADYWDHILARLGVNRMGHLVEPGLYALGSPAVDSPVFVTANYTLSFDALRSALDGVDGYILVLDTKGINVWCAAGKGTFGTDELVHRIEATALQNIVNHRTLILPQLGAPGVAAHEVKKRSGFRVRYGPVQADDLPEYLKTQKATPEMRRMHFGLRDRMVLIPVDVVSSFRYMAIGAVAMFFLGGLLASVAVVAALLAGAALFPILLPWIPTRSFSSKGFILGAVVALPFAVTAFLGAPNAVWWLRVGGALIYLLFMPPVTAYLALNFTGASTYTSRSGVRREMFTYIPVMAWTFGSGLVLTIALRLIRVIGGIS
ncbi:MAG: carbon monoxide dehydrogenase [Chloroflexi bacterium]|nr:carbon monoxide dehydrogenase [Chloroflexota bacterium]